MNPAAIVLSGGRASRLGGASKAALEVEGRSLLDRVLDAVDAAGLAPVVVVGEGPGVARPGVVVTREDPPFAGPLAGLAAGMAEVGPAEWVVLLACDLPRAGDLIALLQCARRGADGVIVIDGDGRRQWLAGCYRAAAVRAGIAAVVAERGSVDGLGPRAVLADLDLAEVTDDAGASLDVDTPADLARARTHPR